MKERFPEQIRLRDMFNGSIMRHNSGKRVYKIVDLPDIDLEFRVKTMMGFQDLPCLSFYEIDLLIRSRNRFRFEIVRQEKSGLVVCRALYPTPDTTLNYESVQEFQFREKPLYQEGEEVVVVPARVNHDRGLEKAVGVFYDPYYPEMTGFIDFPGNIYIKPLLGKRLKVSVHKRAHKGDRFVIKTSFLEKL